MRIWTIPALTILCGTAFAAPPAPPPNPGPPPEKPRSIVIDATKFDRDKNVRVETDKIDNFKYARLALFDTNAPVTSVSYTVKPAEAGRWHVLLKARIGAAIALDQDAALATVTAPVRCTECGAIQTPARTHVTGSLGDEAWQVVSLGVVDLAPGMKINLLPVGSDTNAPPRFTDLQFISLLDPAFIGKTQPALPPPAPPAPPAPKK